MRGVDLQLANDMQIELDFFVIMNKIKNSPAYWEKLLEKLEVPSVSVVCQTFTDSNVNPEELVDYRTV
jgi:hypothetical protein